MGAVFGPHGAGCDVYIRVEASASPLVFCVSSPRQPTTCLRPGVATARTTKGRNIGRKCHSEAIAEESVFAGRRRRTERNNMLRASAGQRLRPASLATVFFESRSQRRRKCPGMAAARQSSDCHSLALFSAKSAAKTLRPMSPTTVGDLTLKAGAERIL